MATTPAKKAATTVASKKAPAAKKVAVVRKPAEKPAPKLEVKPGVKAAPAKVAKPVKLKVKLVRDSFTMPEGEYVRIAGLKKRLLGLKIAAKKSELLRAGVALLVALKDAELLAAVGAIEKVKTGRPAKGGK